MTELVEPADLEELRRLAEAATPGPWHAPEPPDGVGEGMLYADDGWAIVDSFVFASDERREATKGWRVPFTRPDAQHQRDAAYIAAANPAAILALLDRFAALQDELEHLREDPYQNRHIDAEQRVVALEELLTMILPWVAPPKGGLTYAAYERAKAILSERAGQGRPGGHQEAEGER